MIRPALLLLLCLSTLQPATAASDRGADGAWWKQLVAASSCRRSVPPSVTSPTTYKPKTAYCENNDMRRDGTCYHCPSGTTLGKVNSGDACYKCGDGMVLQKLNGVDVCGEGCG